MEEVPLPRFEEDDHVEENKRNACRRAEGLAGKSWFFGSVALSFFAGVLPSFARHWGGGPAPFAEPLDFAWVGLFSGLFAACVFGCAIKRKRKLKESLSELDGAMKKVLDRHEIVWLSTLRYSLVREALIRNERLSSLLKSRLQETEAEIDAARNLQNFLDAQIKYYREICTNPERRQERAVPIQEEPLASVSTWLQDALNLISRSIWANANPNRMVHVFDERISSQQDRGMLPSGYFTSQVSLLIQSAEGK
jgi:hypothetical protein